MHDPAATEPPSPSMTALPRVSVIMVNWNRYDDVKFALASLRRADYPEIEIIVVDNSSADGSTERLAAEPDVRLVCLCRNCGPCEGRNAGMTMVTGKYVMFLDSDAIVARDTLRVLVGRMEAEPDLGILGCRILNYTTRRIDQWVYSQPYATHGGRPFDSYAFSAAGAILRADVVRKVGGLWEPLFIYNEEVDLALGFIRAGYRVGYEPDAHVLHNPSGSGRVDRSNYFFYQIRNWIWIFYKHYPFVARWRKIGLYIAVYLTKGLLNRYPRAVVKGIWAGLRGTDVVTQFPNKLSGPAVRMIDGMNRGRRLRLKKMRTGADTGPLIEVDTGDLPVAETPVNDVPGHAGTLARA